MIVTFVPTMLLTRVDLPTFGRPTTATNPEWSSGGAVVNAQPASCAADSPGASAVA